VALACALRQTLLSVTGFTDKSRRAWTAGLFGSDYRPDR
jgi:hypothetical protein